MKLISVIIVSFFFLQCSQQRTPVSSAGLSENAEQELVEQMAADSTNFSERDDSQQEPEKEAEPLSTEIRFRNFAVVIHNFRGYEIDHGDGEKYLSDSTYAGLRWKFDSYYKRFQESYLQAKKDTVYLSEFSNELIPLNHNLIQIKAGKTDSFSMSYAYLWNLSELVEERNVSPEEYERAYAAAFKTRGISSYYPMEDSLGRFFFTPASPEYENWATGVEGKMDKRMLAEEFRKIRERYGLRDTFVEFDGGEGGNYYGLLAGRGKLYSYDNSHYIFRISRYRGARLMETRYIVIELGYGC